MITIDFEGRNVIFTDPITKDSSEQCPCPAYCGIDSGGNKFINTVWQPNYEDIQAIIAGRPIVLHILGDFQPACTLFTCNEKGEINQ